MNNEIQKNEQLIEEIECKECDKTNRVTFTLIDRYWECYDCENLNELTNDEAIVVGEPLKIIKQRRKKC